MWQRRLKFRSMQLDWFISLLLNAWLSYSSALQIWEILMQCISTLSISLITCSYAQLEKARLQMMFHSAYKI